MLNVQNIRTAGRGFTSVVNNRCVWLLLSLLCMGAARHPYYLGMTDIKYNSKTATLEFSVKLFTNDFETALRKTSGKTVDLLHPADKAGTDTLVYAYIRQRLSVNVNSKPVTYAFVGYEKEEDAIWVFLESGKLQKPRTVAIENKLLYDYLPQQINIVQVEVDGQKQSSKVMNPDSKFSFLFK